MQRETGPAVDGESRKQFGFPKAVRILKKSDFNKTFEFGKKGVSNALVVFARPNGLTFSRLGLAVSKKNGNAVKRNRIRRMIREAFRLQRPDLPKGFDLVCIPRKDGFPGNTNDLLHLFRKTVLKAIKKIQENKTP